MYTKLIARNNNCYFPSGGRKRLNPSHTLYLQRAFGVPRFLVNFWYYGCSTVRREVS